MRYLCVTKQGILDTLTGELTERIELAPLIRMKPGGIIVGRNMYELLSLLGKEVRGKDDGTTLRLWEKSDKPNAEHPKGPLYYSHLSHRFEKVRYKGKRYRPGSIKWLILNLELFCEPPEELTEQEDIESAARALVGNHDVRRCRRTRG